MTVHIAIYDLVEILKNENFAYTDMRWATFLPPCIEVNLIFQQYFFRQLHILQSKMLLEHDKSWKEGIIRPKQENNKMKVCHTDVHWKRVSMVMREEVWVFNLYKLCNLLLQKHNWMNMTKKQGKVLQNFITYTILQLDRTVSFP